MDAAQELVDAHEVVVQHRQHDLGRVPFGRDEAAVTIHYTIFINEFYSMAPMWPFAGLRSCTSKKTKFFNLVQIR